MVRLSWHSPLVVLSVLKATAALVDFYPWNSHLDHLETLLTDGLFFFFTANGFVRDNMPGTSPIAAEWIRLAFHDMATHNIEDGTGGLDQSIAFELNRTENAGQGLKLAYDDFKRFATPQVSMADVIALGTIVAVASNSGPVIPFKGGRKDVFAAGLPGVPEPHQDVATHTELFRKQGFSASEMIELVACGHSVGSVNNNDFPTLVPTKGEFKFFDSTHALFDDTVVQEYLNGTTQNPLVNGPNATLTSDARLFNSDGNSTLRNLVSTPTKFGETCRDLFAKMLNTVATGVTLTDVIEPAKFKPGKFKMTVRDNAIVYNTTFRIIDPASKATVSMHWTEQRGEGPVSFIGWHTAKTSHDSEFFAKTYIKNLGMTAQTFDISIALHPANYMTKVWFYVTDPSSNSTGAVAPNDQGFDLVENSVFIDYGRSFKYYEGADPKLRAVIAVRDTKKPTSFYLEAYNPGPNPSRDKVELTPDDAEFPPMGGFHFYSGLVTAPKYATLFVERDGKTLETETLNPAADLKFLVVGKNPYRRRSMWEKVLQR